MIVASFQILAGVVLLITNRPFSEHCRAFQKRTFGLEYTDSQFRIPIIVIALILVGVGIKELATT